MSSPVTAVRMRSYRISAGTPPSASNAAAWQRSTVGRSWCKTKRAHSIRLCPSTSENSQTMRTTPGSSVNSVRNWAKSTCACCPGAVSKRRSKPDAAAGRMSRRKSVTRV
ncbi:hypothetical protein GCM10009416_41400 [Craurococcus roseus]|uniref:Uncharacterized protein n=1 Tax=Craurococcus roseus TaxID=77585 RepID=A0ABN1FVV8_9PROT